MKRLALSVALIAVALSAIIAGYSFLQPSPDGSLSQVGEKLTVEIDVLPSDEVKVGEEAYLVLRIRYSGREDARILVKLSAGVGDGYLSFMYGDRPLTRDADGYYSFYVELLPIDYLREQRIGLSAELPEGISSISLKIKVSIFSDVLEKSIVREKVLTITS